METVKDGSPLGLGDQQARPETFFPRKLPLAPIMNTVTTLIIENAPNLRTLIFGEIPNLFQREPSCLSNPNLLVVIQYSGED